MTLPTHIQKDRFYRKDPLIQIKFKKWNKMFVVGKDVEEIEENRPIIRGVVENSLQEEVEKNKIPHYKIFEFDPDQTPYISIESFMKKEAGFQTAVEMESAKPIITGYHFPILDLSKKNGWDIQDFTRSIDEILRTEQPLMLLMNNQGYEMGIYQYPETFYENARVMHL